MRNHFPGRLRHEVKLRYFLPSARLGQLWIDREEDDLEAALLTLDVFFMFLLVLSVVRRAREKNRAPDLGFFAYREHRTEPETAERSGKSA